MYLCRCELANHSNHTHTMAVIRTSANAIRRGRVGDTTYYYRNGQQIARQSRNNSNYGGMATRLPVQQSNRVKWANLVNFFKVGRLWMKGAFESKKPNQTDYNAFMSRNKSANPVCLNKTQAAQSCCCVYPYIVSQGSLSPIGYEFIEDEGFSTGLNLGAAVTLNSATIGAVSQAIIDNNVAWRDGDNLAIIVMGTYRDDESNPYTVSRYYEFTLDTTSSTLFSTLPFAAYSVKSDSNVWMLDVESIPLAGDRAVALIHTRIDGGLKVSSQTLAVASSSVYTPLTTAEWEAECAASYGIDEEVLLEPTD